MLTESEASASTVLDLPRGPDLGAADSADLICIGPMDLEASDVADTPTDVTNGELYRGLGAVRQAIDRGNDRLDARIDSTTQELRDEFRTESARIEGKFDSEVRALREQFTSVVYQDTFEAHMTSVTSTASTARALAIWAVGLLAGVVLSAVAGIIVALAM